MQTLRDLVLTADDADVIQAVALLYHQQQIDRTEPAGPDDEPAWDVWCSKTNDPERYGLDLSPWEEWLAMRAPQLLCEAMPPAEIVGHCVWEMTFYGFTQERIAETRSELERRVREIDEGKVEMIPWEKVKEKIRTRLESEEKERETPEA